MSSSSPPKKGTKEQKITISVGNPTPSQPQRYTGGSLVDRQETKEEIERREQLEQEEHDRAIAAALAELDLDNPKEKDQKKQPDQSSTASVVTDASFVSIAGGAQLSKDTDKDEKKAIPATELTGGIGDAIQAQAFEIERERAHDIDAALQAELKNFNLTTITDQDIANIVRRISQFHDNEPYDQQLDIPLQTEIEFRGEAGDEKDAVLETKSSINAIRDTTKAMLSKREVNLKENKEKKAALTLLSEDLIDSLLTIPGSDSMPRPDLVALMAISKAVSDRYNKQAGYDPKIENEFIQLTSQVHRALEGAGRTPDLASANKILPLLEEYRKKIASLGPNVYNLVRAAIYELERPVQRAIILARIEPSLQQRSRAHEEKKAQPTSAETKQPPQVVVSDELKQSAAEFKSRNQRRTAALDKWTTALEDFNQDITTVRNKKKRELDEKDEPVDLTWVTQLRANINRADFEIGQIRKLTDTYATQLERAKKLDEARELRRLSNKLINNLENSLISDQTKLDSLREYQKYLLPIKKSETQQLIDMERALLARVNPAAEVKAFVALQKKTDRPLRFVDRRTKYYQQLMDNREGIVRDIINQLKDKTEGAHDERADKIIAQVPALQMEDQKEAVEVRNALIKYLKDPRPQAKFVHPHLAKVPVELFALHVSMPDRHFTSAVTLTTQEPLVLAAEQEPSKSKHEAPEKSKLVSKASFSTSRAAHSNFRKSLSSKQLANQAAADAELQKLAIPGEYNAFREGLVIGATVEDKEHDLVKTNYNISGSHRSFQEGIDKAKSVAVAKAKNSAQDERKSAFEQIAADETQTKSKKGAPIPLLLPERKMTAEEVRRHFSHNPNQLLSEKDPKVFEEKEFKQHFKDHRRAKIIGNLLNKKYSREFELKKTELFSKHFGLKNPDSIPNDEKFKVEKKAANDALQEAIRKSEEIGSPVKAQIIKQAEEFVVSKHIDEVEPELDKAMIPVNTYERKQKALEAQKSRRQSHAEPPSPSAQSETDTIPHARVGFADSPPMLSRSKSSPGGSGIQSVPGTPGQRTPGTPVHPPHGSPSVRLKASHDEAEREKDKERRKTAVTAKPSSHASVVTKAGTESGGDTSHINGKLSEHELKKQGQQALRQSRSKTIASGESLTASPVPGRSPVKLSPGRLAVIKSGQQGLFGMPDQDPAQEAPKGKGAGKGIFARTERSDSVTLPGTVEETDDKNKEKATTSKRKLSPRSSSDGT